MEMGGIFFKNFELYPPLQLGSGEYTFLGKIPPVTQQLS